VRCGGILSDSIIANFLLILRVKKFENWSKFDKVIRCTQSVPNLLGHPVCSTVKVDIDMASEPVVLITSLLLPTVTSFHTHDLEREWTTSSRRAIHMVRYYYFRGCRSAVMKKENARMWLPVRKLLYTLQRKHQSCYICQCHMHDFIAIDVGSCKIYFPTCKSSLYRSIAKKSEVDMMILFLFLKPNLVSDAVTQKAVIYPW